MVSKAMTANNGTENSKSGIIYWVLAAVLIAAAIVANQHFAASVAGPLRIIGGIVVTAIVLAILAQTQQGKLAIAFAQDARSELRKVVWPTRQETVQMTMGVMFIVVLVTLFLWLVDTGLLALIGWITGQRG